MLCRFIFTYRKLNSTANHWSFRMNMSLTIRFQISVLMSHYQVPWATFKGNKRFQDSQRLIHWHMIKWLLYFLDKISIIGSLAVSIKLQLINRADNNNPNSSIQIPFNEKNQCNISYGLQHHLSSGLSWSKVRINYMLWILKHKKVYKPALKSYIYILINSLTDHVTQPVLQ